MFDVSLDGMGWNGMGKGIYTSCFRYDGYDGYDILEGVVAVGTDSDDDGCG